MKEVHSAIFNLMKGCTHRRLIKFAQLTWLSAGLLLAWQPSACGQYSYTDPQSTSRAQQFGLDFPEIPQSSETNFTVTRHHRFGNQTGIGSSYLQTTSSTTEDQPTFMYRPTAVSPLVPTFSSPAFKGIARQAYSSQFVTSPALSPLESETGTAGGINLSPGLNLEQGPGSTGSLRSVSPPALKGFSFSFYGNKQPAGGALGRRLVDPMKGL